MKKKLQMVASIIGYPEILIWDEPHKGLDALLVTLFPHCLTIFCDILYYLLCKGIQKLA